MAIAFVNGTDRSSTGFTDGSNQASAVWGNNLIAGNSGILCAFWKTAAGGNITTVVDSVGNTYLDCGEGETPRPLGDGALQVLGCANLAAGTTPTVQFQFDAAANSIDFYLLQYSGCNTTTLFGVTERGTAPSGTVLTTAAFTPGITDGMVFTFAVSNDTDGLVGLIGGTNGTSRIAPSGWATIMQDRVYAGAMGSGITAAANMSSAFTLGAIISAVVLPAAGGGGGSAVPTMQAINRRRR